jgi:hypothetical protein
VSDKPVTARRTDTAARVDEAGNRLSRGPTVPLVNPEELGALLMAHCNQARMELPPGKPGVRWAADFLGALPVACSRRLPDLLATGPKVFEFLVGQGFFAAMPSPRLVPQVLGLVAKVSPLLEARSSRQWALWLARVWDSRSPVLGALRKQTPAHLIGITTPAPSGPPLRAAQIRDERDRLAVVLGDMTAECARRRAALVEVQAEHDRMAAELAAAMNRERHALDHASLERGRLSAELSAAVEREKHTADDAATQEALAKEMHRERDRLAAEVSAVRAENSRMSKSLAQAGEAVELRSAERDMLARVLADERAAGEQVRDELLALQNWVNDAQRPLMVDGQDARAVLLQRLTANQDAWRRLRERLAKDFGAERRGHETEAARGPSLAEEVDALKRENAALRADQDGLRARGAALESESRTRAGVREVENRDEAERALGQMRQELTVAREGTKDLMDRLDRRTNTLLDTQQTMETLEVELAAANAEIAQWQAGYSAANLILIAREMAAAAVRKEQAARPSLEDDD